MRYLFKVLAVALFFILNYHTLQAVEQNQNFNDSISKLQSPIEKYFSDSIAVVDTIKTPPYNYTIFAASPAGENTIVFADPFTLSQRIDSLMDIPISRSDSLLYASNSLLLPLVYLGRDINEVWDRKISINKYLYPEKKDIFYFKTPKTSTSEKLVSDLRTDARRYFVNNHAELYTKMLDELPSLETFMSRPIIRTSIGRIDVHSDEIVLGDTKIEYEKVPQLYWIKKANAMLQFSQNYVSKNWHQGGHSNLAFLSIFLGEFNYDNRKNLQWDNKIEWRAGFNSVDGDTLRKISTNDDLVRLISKFGVKAGGNWYYSIAGEFSTHVMNSYKGINSNVLKTKLLTPVRATIGVGMDFKYKKILSLMIAPLTYKYIYMNDTVNMNPNQFGIKKGKNQLKQFGSSLLAQFNYSPMMNWGVSSKLSAYTDYKKYSVDWEIVNNFTINRYLTARLLLNPRYDNTVILKGGEKAEIQFKELLSVGFSYRFF